MFRTKHQDTLEPTTRIFRPTRVVALALIAVLVTALVYVPFAPGAGPVAVPEGANAGDLILEPCEYATENGSYSADCGTLVVPETRTDPESRLIALPVTRVRGMSDDSKEPDFFLTGGPGQSNINFEFANRYTDDRDFVLVGYRGVDGSVRLDCPEVESALKRSTDILSEGFFRAYGDAHRSCADRLTDDGVDLASYGLVQQVDDLETARVAFGYDQINLLSESAGTRTAMIYAWRYPESIHRSVMVAVNPPGAFLLDADTTDEQIGRYAALCADDDSCRTRTDDLAATMRLTAADMPDRWLFLPIKDANVRVTSMFGLIDSTPAASPTPAPMTLDAWLSAAGGDASGFWVTSVLGDLLFPELFVRGQYASAPMLDAQAARDYFARGQGDLSNLGRAATAFTWGGGVLADSWPAAPEERTYGQVPTSEVETLLIGGELDPMTPPQVATTQLLPYLPNGHQVVLPGFGHQLTVFKEQPEAGSRLINTFYDSGQVDDSLYVPASIDFTPSMTFGTIAKAAVGVMLALAALTVVSLLVMARRVRTRGRIGPKSGALLRSFYPLVFGIGGWCLGALIVLTTLLGVRIDNELLLILSVGMPIGLGIYWTWVHRDWSARSKRIAGRRPLGTPYQEENLMFRTNQHDTPESTTRATRHALDQRRPSQLDTSHPLTEASTPGTTDAAVSTVEIPQYRRSAILAVWAAAALPMAALAWLVAPAVADRLSGEGNLPLSKALLVCIGVGLIWQFVLVVVLIWREQRTLRWSSIRDALWLRSPRSPSGRTGGRVWLVVIPLMLAYAAVPFVVSWPPSPEARDFGLFLESDAGQRFMSGNWLWFGLLIVLWVFNTVLGEELLFRGFLLPRMNGAFGRGDWVANGVLFAAYHLHVPWAIPETLIADTLFVSYPAKRYRSAWIGIVVHSGQSVVLAIIVLTLVI